MNKLILILMMLILLAPALDALLADNLIYYYSLEDNAATTVVTDEFGSNNLVSSENTNVLHTTDGKINDAFRFSLVTRYIYDTVNLGAYSQGTINFWVNGTCAGAGTTCCLWSAVDNGVKYYELTTFLTDNFQLKLDGVGNTACFDESKIAKGMGMVTILANATSTGVYLNGTSQCTVPTSHWFDDLNSMDTLAFNRNVDAGNNGVTGIYDEIGIWSRALTGAELISLFNAGAGKSYADIIAGGTTTYMNISIVYPRNNTVITVANITDANHNMTINITHNTSSTTTCGINDTDFGNSYKWGAGNPANYTFTNSTTLRQGYYNILVYCNHSSSYNATKTVRFYVNLIGIDNCSTYDTYALNISLYEEHNLTKAFGNIDIALYSGVANYSLQLREHRQNYSLCINPKESSHNISAILSYQGDGYSTRAYYLIDYILTNQTQTLQLYMVKSALSNNIFLYVKDKFGVPKPEYYMRTMKFYPQDNIFRVVNIDKTNSDGLTSVYIVPYSIYYKFMVLDNYGNVVYESQMDKISQSTYYFYVGEGSKYLSTYKQIKNLNYNLAWNNATNTFTYSWSDSSGATREGCLNVKRMQYYGDTTVCNTCGSGSSGSINCVLVGNITDKTYLADAYIDLSGGSYHHIAWYELMERSASKFDSLELFMGTMLIITVMFAGAFNLVFAIVLMIVGLVFMVMAGFIQTGIVSGIITLIVIGAILLFKVEI